MSAAGLHIRAGCVWGSRHSEALLGMHAGFSTLARETNVFRVCQKKRGFNVNSWSSLDFGSNWSLSALGEIPTEGVVRGRLGEGSQGLHPHNLALLRHAITRYPGCWLAHVYIKFGRHFPEGILGRLHSCHKSQPPALSTRTPGQSNLHCAIYLFCLFFESHHHGQLG